MSYEEEKNYLCDKCADFIYAKCGDDIYPINKDDNKVKLDYFGAGVETELLCMYLETGDVCLESRSEYYPDDTDHSLLNEFSNDEIKAIMQKFGIEY